MKINSKLFTIWGKYVAYSAIMAIGIIGKSPLDFTAHDWKQTFNAVWISLVPVIIKWANPKDELTLTLPKK
jgi:hypothetical protein